MWIDAPRPSDWFPALPGWAQVWRTALRAGAMRRPATGLTFGNGPRVLESEEPPQSISFNRPLPGLVFLLAYADPVLACWATFIRPPLADFADRAPAAVLLDPARRGSELVSQRRL